MVLEHLSEYIEMEGTSMGIFSEQTGESLHSDFAKTWEHYKVKDSDKCSFGTRLLKAVVHYNSSHI